MRCWGGIFIAANALGLILCGRYQNVEEYKVQLLKPTFLYTTHSTQGPLLYSLGKVKL